MYYLRWGNTQSGPYESHQILQLADQGMVNRVHEVVDSVTSHSMTVEDFRALMASRQKMTVLDLDQRDKERERIRQLQTQHDEIERLKQENAQYALQIRTITATATAAIELQRAQQAQPRPMPSVVVMPPLPPRPPQELAPRVQVIQQHHHHYPQPVSVVAGQMIQPHPAGVYHRRNVKSRGVYIILAFFLGMMGIHNFYAGRMRVAIIQLLLLSFLSILAMPFLFIMAMMEIFFVNTDGDGRPMV